MCVCVFFFNGASPDVNNLVRTVKEEGALWFAGGAKELQWLLVG